MRRVSLLAIVVAAAGLVIGVSPASGLDEPEVIRLVDVEEGFVPLDPGFSEEAPPPLGGRFAFTDGLYEWAGAKRGNRVGRIEGLCTFTNVNPSARAVTAYCTATAYLPKGRVLVAAFIRFAEEGPGTFIVSVIGGTGRYANARGTATIKDLPSGNSAFVFRLVP